ncbi:MAG: PIG-L family deacetylase [Candidatus Hydrogenedentes bacterium]|nr:PIG-L family deacetylase [Candidatus Hydrogenedentota bacterium]
MNVVIIGAHPDDAEFFAGGVSIKWTRLGHRVLFVSATNGDVGHHEVSGGALAQRRAAEARRSARIAGASERVLDYHDGEFLPTLEARKRIVRLIREFEADIVMTHRPWDYHPDHRYTAMAVQDAAFMVTVPLYCPDAPALRRNPVFLYLMDGFQRPYPFRADIAVAVDDVMDEKWAMLDAMESQVYEWLPWLEGRAGETPTDSGERKAFLRAMWDPFFLEPAQRGRDALAAWYGPERAAAVRYAELFEICEYGRQPAREELREFFPFFDA